jgi:hypothetical protein
MTNRARSLSARDRSREIMVQCGIFFVFICFAVWKHAVLPTRPFRFVPSCNSRAVKN